jgi:NADH:ubiquinone oxidoreductase subunit 2 (subunit N)
VMLLSLAGVPPLGGFMSKFVLFMSAVRGSFEEGYSWLLWLAIAGIVNSLISLFYYAKVIRYIYAEAPKAETRTRFTLAQNVALIVAMVLIVLVGVWPQLVMGPAVDGAMALLP